VGDFGQQRDERKVDRPMRISIFTLAIDSSRYLDEAIASVPYHEHDDVEHVLVHDGSPSTRNRLSARYPRIRVLAGPGRGVTPAAAMGIAATTGDFILPLNSDDRLVAGALAGVARAARAHPGIEVWTGGLRIFRTEPDGRETILREIRDPASTQLTLPNALDDTPLLNARFVARSVYQRVGVWDPAWAACSDREFAVRMILAGITDTPLGLDVCEMRWHEHSKTMRSTAGTVPDYMRAHVALARRYFADERLDPVTRKRFRDWHARELLRVGVYQAQAGQVGAALESLAGGFAFDLLWPWRARTIVGAARRRNRSG
jgi:glycosyltransferase involved in cell wall biosynthesis